MLEFNNLSLFSWCLGPSMERWFDREKNRVSLFFVGSPDFFQVALKKTLLLKIVKKLTFV